MNIEAPREQQIVHHKTSSPKGRVPKKNPEKLLPQVHTQGRLKEERLEEGGGEGDCVKKKGREVGGHHLTAYSYQ